MIARLSIAGRPLPIVGRLRAYVCGVTPYDVTHLGHAATFVWIDTVARLLRHLGTDVELTRNVTDVDDVLLAAARRQGAPYDRFAAVHQFRFDQDMAALGVRRPEHEPRAHNFVEPVVAVAAALLASDHAYVRNGSVYFRGAWVPEQAGVPRAEALRLAAEYGDAPDDPAKDDPLDVAVWRGSDSEAGGAAPDAPAWPSPWGPGRPGWHAECTAMALATFGPALDLHAGGAELRFPHHAYEAAQAEAVTGVRPFARAWLHVGTVRVDGAKMAKSAGNLVLVSELLGHHSPAAVRLLLLDRPWAAAWDYRSEDLDGCERRLDELFTAAGRGGGSSDAAEDEVLAALLDDLDVPRALTVALDAGGPPARTVVQVLGLA